jgi:hypothetical protein
MSQVAPDVDIDTSMTEQIKWWDVTDALAEVAQKGQERLEEALLLLRDCQHPDAQWLAALFPADVEVTREGMLDALRQHGEDARALYVTFLLDADRTGVLLREAAEMGYAPAQAQLSNFITVDEQESFLWAEASGEAGDRDGLFQLGFCYLSGVGCTKDVDTAIELFHEAAQLGSAAAQFFYGETAFGDHDWQRYHWWGCAAARGFGSGLFCAAILRLLPSFESGELGGILHEVAPVLRQHPGVTALNASDVPFSFPDLLKFDRVVELHEAMLDRARQAIACWSVCGRRRGVVKDMRVVIAKMAWEEVWRWGEKEEPEEAEEEQQSNEENKRRKEETKMQDD